MAVQWATSLFANRGSNLLTILRINSLEISIALFIGFTVMVIVSMRPRLFWHMLIIVNIVGNGPRLMGYFFWDELLTGCVILGALLRVALLNTKPQKNVSNPAHKFVFFLWVFYMVMESIIGIMVNSDLRIIRWILFYIELGLLSSILYYRSREFPFPPVRQFSIVVLITTVIYYIAYLAHGMIIESMLGIGTLGRVAAQYLTEGFLWSGSAMAIFPTLIAMASAIFLMNDSSFKVRMLALFSMFLMMFVGFYYDSRLSWVIIFAMCLVSFKRFRLTKLIKIIVLFGLMFHIFMPNNPIGKFLYTIFEGTQTLWHAGESGMGRKLQFEAGLLRLTDNQRTFLIGDGIYSHRFTINPHVNELYRKYIPEKLKFNVPSYEKIRAAQDVGPGGTTIFRTTAFTALVIDTGIIGMTLFYLNYIFTGLKLIKQKSTQRIILLTILFLAFMWLFNNNISEVVFLYILIMPRGLLEQLSTASSPIKFQKESI